MEKKENENKHFSLENTNETDTFNPRNPYYGTFVDSK